MAIHRRIALIMLALGVAGIISLGLVFVYFGLPEGKVDKLDEVDEVDEGGEVDEVDDEIEEVTVDFEDDPQLGAFIICGTSDCDPAHHEWIRSKGIDVKGTEGEDGFLRTSNHGSTWVTGTVLEYNNQDQLNASNLGFIFTILDSTSNYFEAEVGTIASITHSDIPAKVLLRAFDSNGTLLNQKRIEFTTVTNSSFTPGKLSINTDDFRISTVTLVVLDNPLNQFWIESISFTRVTFEPSPDTRPPAISVFPARGWAFENESVAIDYSEGAVAYDAKDGVIPLNINSTQNDTASEGLSSFVCTPPAGSLFSVGNTSVSCVATDSAGNTASRIFVVEIGLCKTFPDGTIECRNDWE